MRDVCIQEELSLFIGLKGYIRLIKLSRDDKNMSIWHMTTNFLYVVCFTGQVPGEDIM